MPKVSIRDYTGGVVVTASDLLLVSIYFGFNIAAKKYGKGWSVHAKPHKSFPGVKYKTLKRAASYIEQLGLVNTDKKNIIMPELAEKGINKVDHIIPKYNKKRVWDGRLCLITYDIPEKQNRERNLLRGFLRKLRCGMLQQSVWITPYNPIKAVRDFADNHSLQGLVIISYLGKDGAVGNVKVPDLMKSIYKLENLNKKYKKFIVKAGMEKGPSPNLIFNYLSILKEDPQLPFDLLPEGWLGDNAHQVFRRITR